MAKSPEMDFGAFHKTRLAPTPSGFLHIGNVFSFALTAAIARKTGASILLRIDDMDRDRVEKQYLDDIFETLRFLDIPWDEGPKDTADFEAQFSQRHRLQSYRAVLEKLVKTRLVYACNCSRKQINETYGGVYPGTCRHKNIPLDTPDVAWRIDTKTAEKIAVKSIDNKIIVAGLPDALRHFVIRKKDGFPAYQLTSLVDDLHFGVDLIVRGEDLFPSTLAQLFLADLLNETKFLETTFYHHVLLTDGGRKLSKSAGDASIRHRRQSESASRDVYGIIGDALGMTLAHWRDLDATFTAIP